MGLAASMGGLICVTGFSEMSGNYCHEITFLARSRPVYDLDSGWFQTWCLSLYYFFCLKCNNGECLARVECKNIAYIPVLDVSGTDAFACRLQHIRLLSVPWTENNLTCYRGRSGDWSWLHLFNYSLFVLSLRSAGCASQDVYRVQEYPPARFTGGGEEYQVLAVFPK